MHDAVPRAHRECLAVLPQQTLAAEHEEDLLVGTVVVRRGGEAVLGDFDPAQADRARARLAAEVPPHSFDVADRKLARRTVVQVGDLHARDPTSRPIAEAEATTPGEGWPASIIGACR